MRSESQQRAREATWGSYIHSNAAGDDIIIYHHGYIALTLIILNLHGCSYTLSACAMFKTRVVAILINLGRHTWLLALRLYASACGMKLNLRFVLTREAL